mgnify:CR=1 FL=1
MITKQEVKGLLARIQGLAKAQGLTSVHAYKTCCRHLENAVRFSPKDRVTGIQHAHNHFQILRAAAAEKATRGKA